MKNHFTVPQGFQKFIFCLLFWAISPSIFAQNTAFWKLNGTISDATNTAVPFANVYINNSSVGTTSDVSGRFSLKIPKSIPKIELVVSFIGYKTVKKILTIPELSHEITIKLEASTTLLKEVVVSAQKDKSWNRKFKKFKKALLGESDFTNSCQILNPEILDLTNKEKNQLSATVSKPLIILNNALGYKITYSLSTFTTDGITTYYSGDKYFNELKPKDKKQESQWKKNRSEAFKNSFRNFLVSLRKNQLEKNGFEIYSTFKPKFTFYRKSSVASEVANNNMFPQTAKAVCSYDSVKKEYVLISNYPLLIFLTRNFSIYPAFSDYPFEFSQVVLPRKFATFTENGWLTKTNELVLMNYWGSEGFSTLLPIDYIENEEQIVPGETPQQSDYWEIKGQVLSQNQRPIHAAEVYVNQSSFATTSDAKGNFYLKIPQQFQKVKLVIESEGFVRTEEEFYQKRIHQDSIYVLEKSQAMAVSKVAVKDEAQDIKKHLLGDTPLAKKCEILNPEVLTLTQKKGTKAVVTASKPVLIQNNALGYKIKLNLDSLVINDTETQFFGNSYFENLQANDEKEAEEWQRNQRKVYQDSFRNFIVALEQNKLTENGFDVFKILKLQKEYSQSGKLSTALGDSSIRRCQSAEILKYDSQNKRYYLYSDAPLLVFLTKHYKTVPLFVDYHFVYSLIDLRQSPAIFSESGEIIEKNDMVLRDFWGNIGFANTLPIDYTKPEGLSDKLEVVMDEIAPKSINTDSVRMQLDLPYKQEQAMQHIKSTFEVDQSKRDFGVATADYVIKINESDHSYTIFDLLRRVPGLRVFLDPRTFTYSIYFAENILPKQEGQKQDATPALYLDGTLYADGSTVYAILSTLNVKDIEKIGAVRYGGGAAFGVRGGNGAILITTKK